MNTVSQHLRDLVAKLRHTPMPLADIIPTLQQAADEIDKLTQPVEYQVLGFVSRYGTEIHSTLKAAAPGQPVYIRVATETNEPMQADIERVAEQKFFAQDPREEPVQAEAPTASNEREAFERWWFADATVDALESARSVEAECWLAWQARAALATQQAEAPTASNEREEQKRWLNKLLNDFAKACAFGDDNLARMVAANEIHELFNRAALATQPTASNAGERK